MSDIILFVIITIVTGAIILAPSYLEKIDEDR